MSPSLRGASALIIAQAPSYKVRYLRKGTRLLCNDLVFTTVNLFHPTAYFYWAGCTKLMAYDSELISGQTVRTHQSMNRN